MQKESIDSILLSTQQQFYDYALRLRGLVSIDPYTLYQFHQRYDSPFHEQPKPSYSYIGLIAMAILSSPERQLVLSDIYQWILDHYSYFHARGAGWRNSIRHNLSLNDCFVKAGRSPNGKGHYWSIHPANLADFISGDFRRRRAQRRVRKSMGLSIPEEENDDDIEEILPINETDYHFEHSLSKSSIEDQYANLTNSRIIPANLFQQYFNNIQHIAISYSEQTLNLNQTPIKQNPRKRCFDVDSLLAPDQPCLIKRQKSHFIYSPISKSDSSTDTNFST